MKSKLLGQTVGVPSFAMLTTFGNDPGDDLGIRLSGMVGFVLTFAAGLVFTRCHERKVLRELAEAGESW